MCGAACVWAGSKAEKEVERGVQWQCGTGDSMVERVEGGAGSGRRVVGKGVCGGVELSRERRVNEPPQ